MSSLQKVTKAFQRGHFLIHISYLEDSWRGGDKPSFLLRSLNTIEVTPTVKEEFSVDYFGESLSRSHVPVLVTLFMYLYIHLLTIDRHVTKF
jgi:hypothetical protein